LCAHAVDSILIRGQRSSSRAEIVLPGLSDVTRGMM
jgi:hypothetical protein